PTEKWVVDFDDAQCVASRNYGSAEKPLFLVLKPSPMGDSIMVSVLRKGSKQPLAEEHDGEIIIDRAPPVAVSFLSFGSSSGIQSTRITLSDSQFLPIRSAAALSVRGEGINESFVLRQLPELMRTLDACVADLQRAWNVGPYAATALKQRAQGSLAGLFSSDDYPGMSLFKGESGTVGVALLIDAQGAVADCTVSKTSGVAALDAQACTMIAKRVKITPAVGLDGKPARDSYSQRITWRF
ncbi:MAG: energy transducer TonB, partial [Sphingomicrobium sp.]